MSKKIITVSGCGRMGGAILSILSAKEGFKLYGVDKNSEALKKFDQSGIRLSTELSSIEYSDFLIAAVKPRDMEGFLEEVINSGIQFRIFISLAAGISTYFIKGKIGQSASIARVMPNTPLLIGKGLSCISYPDANENEYAEVERLFSLMGKTLRVDEKYMDTVTALSGSGPAYFFLMGEVMRDLALKRGFTSEEANLLASSTIKGAGAMMMWTEADFTSLKKAVTSPGGTTEAALKVLSENSFGDILMKAIEAAEARSKEISEELNET